MKCRVSLDKKEGLNDSKIFFKGLQQKFMNMRTSTNSSMKQSCVSQISRKSNSTKNKKKQSIQNKNITVKNIFDVSKHLNGEQLQKLKDQHTFDEIIQQTQQFADFINEQIYISKCKFLAVKVSAIIQNNQISKTKTQLISKYIAPIIKHFEKASICVYSIGYTQKSQFYDMLSIRKQLKEDTKLLVQTNICNNSKSGIIIKKLMDVAKERQKSMNEGNLIQTVVVKIKGILNEQKQNNNNGENKQMELQISSGGYGEIGMKNLMGAQKLRIFMNVLVCDQLNTVQQIQNKITGFKKVGKVQSQNILMQKIKILQLQLLEKRKQLEQQKFKKAKQQQLQAQIQDLALPSQRPMIDTQKFAKVIQKTIPHSRNISFR